MRIWYFLLELELKMFGMFFETQCNNTTVTTTKITMTNTQVGCQFKSMIEITVNQDLNNRLNGSSSPVLMATSLSYGKAQNLTHHRI